MDRRIILFIGNNKDILVSACEFVQDYFNFEILEHNDDVNIFEEDFNSLLLIGKVCIGCTDIINLVKTKNGIIVRLANEEEEDIRYDSDITILIYRDAANMISELEIFMRTIILPEKKIPKVIRNPSPHEYNNVLPQLSPDEILVFVEVSADQDNLLADDSYHEEEESAAGLFSNGIPCESIEEQDNVVSSTTDI